jgi:hypothetical protein
MKLKRSRPRGRAVLKSAGTGGRIATRADAFLGKLVGDRVRLTILAAALTRGADKANTLENIRSLAHGVRGAAATFSATEIRIAAQALEQAAGVAPVMHESESDVDVWAALETLRDLLGVVTSGRSGH